MIKVIGFVHCVIFVVGSWCLLNFVTKTQQQQQRNIIHTTTTLSQARYLLAATSSGELVFFGGGYNSTGPSDRVDIYNVTSGSWTTTTLSIPRRTLAVTSSQNLVFFGGGRKEPEWPPKTVYDRVDIYNTLNRSWSTATLSQPRCALAATSVGNLVLFGGGYNTKGQSNVVDVFNVTSNTWTTATLSQARGYLAATSVDNRYALFAGGLSGSGPSNVVDIFDSLSGLWNTTTLSQARYLLAATSLGNLAFFGGGYDGNQPSNVVDIFNSTSQTWSTSILSQARFLLAASSSIGDIVAFGGGGDEVDEPTKYYDVVDFYSVTRNTWFTAKLSQPRYRLASTSSMNKIFFGGGWNNQGSSNVVDIFDISLKWETLNIVRRLQETQNQTEKKFETLQNTIKETQSQTEKKLEALQNTIKETQNQLDVKMKEFQEKMKSELTTIQKKIESEIGQLRNETTLHYRDEKTLNELSQKLMKRIQRLRSENKQPPKQITSNNNNNNNTNEQKGTTLFKSLVVFFNKIVQLRKELPSEDDRKHLIKDMNQFPWDITQFTFDSNEEERLTTMTLETVNVHRLSCESDKWIPPDTELMNIYQQLLDIVKKKEYHK